MTTTMSEVDDMIEFLIENSSVLLEPPINGFLYDIFLFYQRDKVDFNQFIQLTNQVNEMTLNGIRFNNHIQSTSIEFISFIKITYIDKLSLLLLCEDVPFKGVINDPPLNLLTLLDNDTKDTDLFTSTSQHGQYKQINQLVEMESCRLKLYREKYQQITTVKPFFDICNDLKHIHLLMTNMNINCDKIHFIPIIQQQTDLKLGDCSYLDTCHKINTCRYLHYRQLNPGSELSNISDSKNYISDFTWGEPVADCTRNILPPQWINCDIRKLEFKKLGKFAAVIADPPWNIHMNLPYGTCNDNELLNLNIQDLQDEGLLLLWVTGRSIEIGRQSLIKWGYNLIDELIWIKINQLMRTICTGRTGHWLNHSKEHLLVGVKGKPKWAHSGIDTDIIVSTTRETSRKPDEVYKIVEQIVGTKSRKLEIFGRDHNLRSGWLTIGNQLTGNKLIEPELIKNFELTN